MNQEPFQLEAAINELKALIEHMESESLSLEEALKYYEQGVNLTRQCQQALQQAEQKIEIISQQLHHDDAK